MATPFQYADLAYVKAQGLMPKADVDALETKEGAGFVDGICEEISRIFDASLVKRYVVPQPSPFPASLRRRVTDVVVRRLYGRRGWPPGGGGPDDEVVKAADAAEAWLQNAVDSEKGLAELVKTNGASAVERGGPLGYSEASPYDWMARQSEAVRG